MLVLAFFVMRARSACSGTAGRPSEASDRISPAGYSSVVARTTVPIPTRVLVTGMRHDDGEIVAAELYAR